MDTCNALYLRISALRVERSVPIGALRMVSAQEESATACQAFLGRIVPSPNVHRTSIIILPVITVWRIPTAHLGTTKISTPKHACPAIPLVMSAEMRILFALVVSVQEATPSTTMTRTTNVCLSALLTPTNRWITALIVMLGVIVRLVVGQLLTAHPASTVILVWLMGIVCT